jgi:hypothetical protein
MILEIQELGERVARLERQNRMMKCSVLATVLLGAVLLCAGAAKNARVIEAEKIILRDARGHARITIGTPESAGYALDLATDAPVIWLTDNNGTDRAMLTTDGLFFASEKGRRAVSLESDPKHHLPNLRLFAPDGTTAWTAR